MSDGGKGSKPRPFSVTQEQFADNWDKIFNKNKDNSGTSKNEYYDILTTEDSLIDNDKKN